MNKIVPPAGISEAQKKLTDDRLRIANNFTESIADECSGVIISGSIAYGPYFAVKETSDIDALVIVSDLQQLFSADEIRSRQPNDIKKMRNNNFDGYGFRKWSVEGVRFSVRVVTQEAFAKICNAEPQFLRIQKATPKKKGMTVQGFDGTVRDYIPEHRPLDGVMGCVSMSPNAILVGENYHIGTYLDRLLSCGSILHDENGWVSKQVDRCWKNVTRKLNDESIRRNGGLDLEKFSIGKALSRYERMPTSSKEFINQKTQQALLEIETEMGISR